MSDDKTIEKIKIPDVDELTKYNGKWKNLNFDKNGRSYLGRLNHDSEKKSVGGCRRCKL